MRNKIICFVEMEAEDFEYVSSDGTVNYPKVCRCVALDDVADFSLAAMPNEEEMSFLVEQGFSQYEPDYDDGMYHFVRKEYLM